MLIGIDANEANLTQNRVGVNQYAFYLLHALKSLASPHRFVIYLKNRPLPDLPAESPAWSYRVIPFPKFWTQTRLPFDLYTHFPRPDVFFSATHYAPRFCPVPTVIAIMDLGFLKSPDHFTRKDYNQLARWTAYSIKKASRLIAISDYTKSDIVSLFGVDPGKITVTPLSFDKELFRPLADNPEAPSILTKYKIHPPYFFFLSSLKPSKNVEGLITAFYEFSQTRDNFQLVISGKKAWRFETIFTLVEKLGIKDKIIFTGFTPEGDVPYLMSQASAFVLPSFYEGFGIPALEAMACGIPVIVANVTSLPEVTGNAGIYVDPHKPETITRGLEVAVAHKKKYSALSLAQVKHFSWDKTARLTLDVLESLKSG